MGSGKYLRLTASVLFAALVLWFGVKLLPDTEKSLRTVTAESAVITDEIILAGTVVREEAPIYAEGDYIVLPTEGKKVYGGEALAVSRRDAEAYFSSLSNANDTAALEVGELFCALSLSKNVEERQSITRTASALLFGAETKKTESTATPQNIIFAEKSGFFCRYCDGYESLSAHDDLGKKASVPENCIGKIVSGDCWFFVAELDTDTKKQLAAGDGVTLGGYPAWVDEITGDTVIFRLRRGLEAHLSDRFLSLPLTLCRYEGISLPREAVQSENGENYIRILHIDGEERLSVDIIYEGGKNCIVRGEGLTEGMQIILP